jgi:hypothetical protein
MMKSGSGLCEINQNSTRYALDFTINLTRLQLFKLIGISITSKDQISPARVESNLPLLTHSTAN